MNLSKVLISFSFAVVCFAVVGCDYNCNRYRETYPGYVLVEENEYDTLIYRSVMYEIYDSIFTKYDINHSIIYHAY